jgi:hypothetical protein
MWRFTPGIKMLGTSLRTQFFHILQATHNIELPNIAGAGGEFEAVYK